MDKHFCPYCMTPVPEGETCPNCGLTAGNYVPSPHHLPPGTVLLDRYLIGRVLGEGGFGITYIGCDLRLEMKVAIKEYYPVNQATRNASASLNVSNLVGPAGAGFERGKLRFLNEARTMARLDKQSVIVSVKDYFEANNTAYIAMEYVEGTTLKELVEQRGGRIPPDELFRILEPLFGALSKMHDNHLIHRDISPDNLMLENGEIRLLDFGCAREAAKGTETLTISLKQGYAPVEQYQSHGGQGPWTDVYALCATIYYCLTGQTPPQAMDRITEDNLILPSKLGVDISPEREQALLKGLRIQQRRRFHSMQELWAALYTQQGAAPAPPTEEEQTEEEPVEERTALDAEEAAPGQPSWETAEPEPRPARPWWKNLRIVLPCAAALFALALLIALLPKGGAPEPSPAPDPTGNTVADEGQSAFAPAAPDDADARFENAVVLDEADPERFAQLMEDDGVKAVILRANMLLPGTPDITKPVRIDAGAYSGSFNLTVTETGYLEVRGIFEFFYCVRLCGGGERVSVADGGEAHFGKNGEAVFVVDAAENLGNLELMEQTKKNVIVIPNESALFAGAVTVYSYEELEAAAKSQTPIILGSDITFPQIERSDPSDWVWLSSPLLIPEGTTLDVLRSFDHGPNLALTSGTLVNRGTLRGGIQVEQDSSVINYGRWTGSAEGEEDGSFWFDGNSRLVNLGEISAADCSRMWEDSLFVNFGTLNAREFFLVGGSMLNSGEIYARHNNSGGGGFILLHGSALTNLNYLTVEDQGHLHNMGLIRNYGYAEFQPGASVENVQLENYGKLNLSDGAMLDTAGSAFFGEGSVETNLAGIHFYRHSYGNDAVVTSEQELRNALESRAVRAILLRGTVRVASDLYVSKDLDVCGELTMAEGAKLTVERACVNLSCSMPSSLAADSLLLYDDASVWLEGESSALELRGGSLEMAASFVGGAGRLAPGDGAAVTLREGSALALQREHEFGDIRLTLESGSTFSCAGALRAGSLNTASTITVDNAFLRIVADTKLINCSLSLKNGANLSSGAGRLELADCAVTIDDGCGFRTEQSDLILSRATTLENRGSLVTIGWAEQTMEAADTAKLVNYGEWVCWFGKSPELRGTAENHGRISIPRNASDSYLSGIAGNSPVRAL